MSEQFDDQETTATSTWSRMLQGNRRFAKGEPEHPWQDKETRESLIDVQNPTAAVLSCSDSRVPPEIIFDAGLGEMFTNRTAGQMIDTSVIESLEYAVSQLNVSLLVVLGHEHCAAIKQGEQELKALEDKLKQESASEEDYERFEEDLDQIIASSDSLFLKEAGMSVWQAQMADLNSAEEYEQVHIARTVEMLVDRSDIIREAIAQERLMIVGARYRLESGLVEVLSF